MPDDFGYGPRPKAFIRDGVLISAADGERGDNFEREGRRVVVVDKNDDVGLFGGDPLFGPLVPFEEWRPVLRLRLAEVDRRADRRPVPGDAPGRYPRHVSGLPFSSERRRASGRREASSLRSPLETSPS